MIEILPPQQAKMGSNLRIFFHDSHDDCMRAQNWSSGLVEKEIAKAKLKVISPKWPCECPPDSSADCGFCSVLRILNNINDLLIHA